MGRRAVRGHSGQARDSEVAAFQPVCTFNGSCVLEQRITACNKGQWRRARRQRVNQKATVRRQVVLKAGYCRSRDTCLKEFARELITADGYGRSAPATMAPPLRCHMDRLWRPARLRLHGFAMTPKQVDGFRDRYTVAGAKDDRTGAYGIAVSLATDIHEVKKLVPVRELSRTLDDLEREGLRFSIVQSLNHQGIIIPISSGGRRSRAQHLITPGMETVRNRTLVGATLTIARLTPYPKHEDPANQCGPYLQRSSQNTSVFCFRCCAPSTQFR